MRRGSERAAVTAESRPAVANAPPSGLQSICAGATNEMGPTRFVPVADCLPRRFDCLSRRASTEPFARSDASTRACRRHLCKKRAVRQLHLTRNTATDYNNGRATDKTHSLPGARSCSTARWPQGGSADRSPASLMSRPRSGDTPGARCRAGLPRQERCRPKCAKERSSRPSKVIGLERQSRTRTEPSPQPPTRKRPSGENRTQKTSLPSTSVLRRTRKQAHASSEPR